jgi:two-component SAPR family response regulator
MSGRHVAERLGVLRPDMKVVFMSGYTDDAIVQHGVLESDVPYFQKPITPEKLARKVRQVLDA